MKPLATSLAFAFVVLYGGAPCAAADQADGSYLTPYTNLWKLTVTREGREVGTSTWSDDMRAVTVDGKPAMRRTQVVTGGRGTQTYVNVFDPKTLRPIAGAFMNSGGDYLARSFAPGAASMTTTDARAERRAMPVQSTVALSEPVYDYNGGMYGLILRGFPLAVGLTGTIATVDLAANKLIHVPFRVVGREAVEGKPGTTVMTWVVDADFVTADGSEAGSVFRFYLSDAAPFVIKLVFTDPKNQLVQTYTMV